MAGKKKVIVRSERWHMLFACDDGTTVSIAVSGSACPVTTLMNADALDKKYIARQLDGRTVESIEFERGE